MIEASTLEPPIPVLDAPVSIGRGRYWLYVCLLSVLGMMASFSIDTYLPAFLAIGRDFGVTQVAVQQTLTVYLVMFGVGMLFYGTLSDTYGRRRIILLAMTGFVAGAAGAGLATGINSLLFFRMVQGACVGAGMVISRAVVRDLYPGHEGQRLMAHISAVFGIAPAVAPVLGGFLLAWFGWRSIFYFLTAISLATLLTCWRHLPETLPKTDRAAFHLGGTLRDYGRVVSHRAFFFQCLAGGLSFSGGIGIYVSAAPDFVMNVLRLPSTAFGWLFLPIIVGMTLGSVTAARLAGRYAPGKLVWISLAIQGVAAVGNLVYMHSTAVPMVPWAVMPVFVYSFGFALGSPAMTLRAMDLFPAVRGLAASMQAFVQMMLFAGVSGFIAPLVYGSGLKMAIVFASGWLASVICWWAGTWTSTPAQAVSPKWVDP